MYRCPINYFKGNLIFNEDDSCWAAFLLQGFNYDYLSTSGKIGKLAQLARLFSSILSDAQIQIIPVEQNLKEHFLNLKKRLKENDILCTTATQQIEITETYLNEKTKKSGRINDYNTYLIVRLNKATEYETVEKVWDMIQYFLHDPINSINVQMNLDTKDILYSKVRTYAKMAARWLQENRIEMSSTSPEETQWLFRRMSLRGTGIETKLFYKNTNLENWEPKADELEIDTEKIVKPYNRDVVNLFSGSITQVDRSLKIANGFATSYQTFMPIAHIPDVMTFPGTEWIYMLQRENIQAEVCIQIKIVPHKAALHKVELKKREIDSQMEHIDSAGADIPEDLSEAKEYAALLEQELKANRSPLLESTVTICLADSDLEELEKKCIRVKELYDDFNIVIERPLTDQTKLFMSFIPSVRNLMKDFVLPLSPITLASGIIGVTRELGDKRGGYIGTIGEEDKPVFFAPELACLLNMSPAITLYGDLGVGKSFAANLLIYLMVLYGGYGLIVDPKGERAHWENDLYALRGLISTVTLGAEAEDRGKLDPYNIYPDDLAEANELAMNVLCDLFALSAGSDENTIIIECQQKMNKVPGKNCMLKLAKLLDELPDTDDLQEKGKGLARKIRTQRENGMAGLLIGDGEENAIRIDNRLNIIQLQNLKMPSPETIKDDYTRDEVLSSILFGQVSAFVKKFALVKRSVPKGILIDESWLVSASTQGRNMEEFISRMGRSLFTVIMYNGHSVTDLPTEGIKNSISHKFVFRSKNNEEEAARLLEYIGLEVTAENMSIIQGLGTGECFFKDLYNRVGVLKFDVVFQDLIDVFSTTPTEDETKLQKKDSHENPEASGALEAETKEKEEINQLDENTDSYAPEEFEIEWEKESQEEEPSLTYEDLFEREDI